MNWRHERPQEMISLLSEKMMWAIEPLEKVNWKEPQTMANCTLAFVVLGEAVNRVCVLYFICCWPQQNESPLGMGSAKV